MAVMLNKHNSKSSTCVHRRSCCLVSPQTRCNGDPALNSQNNHKMMAFIGESDIIKPISDYDKMLKYREKYRGNGISVAL